MTFEGLRGACEPEYSGKTKYDPGSAPQVFRLPGGCHGFNKHDFKVCLSRFGCQGQVRELDGDGWGGIDGEDGDYEWIPGHFVVFSEDIFGIIFIELEDIAMFHRVPNKEIAAKCITDLHHLKVLNV